MRRERASASYRPAKGNQTFYQEGEIAVISTRFMVPGADLRGLFPCPQCRLLARGESTGSRYFFKRLAGSVRRSSVWSRNRCVMAAVFEAKKEIPVKVK